MSDLRENQQALRMKVLRRRVLLGTLAVVALFLAFWRAWDLDLRLFVEILVGSILLVVGTALVGSGVALLLAWLRSRRK